MTRNSRASVGGLVIAAQKQPCPPGGPCAIRSRRLTRSRPSRGWGDGGCDDRDRSLSEERRAHPSPSRQISKMDQSTTELGRNMGGIGSNFWPFGIFRLYACRAAPSLMALPIISNTDKCGGQWNVAAIAIGVIAHGHCARRRLELIFQAIVNDAVKRTTDAVKRPYLLAPVPSRPPDNYRRRFPLPSGNYVSDSFKTPAA
jgi:hypothetical protein